MARTDDPDFQKFDPQFENLEDYIIKITHEIWEERGVSTIRRYYGENMIMHTPHGTNTGADNVILSTFQVLHAFPDRRLLPEDVIWRKEPDNTYLSSHRILSIMTHLGDGLYGKPTGKKLFVRITADCAVKDNIIFEEWLVRDQASTLLQMGKSPEDYALKMAEKEYVEDQDPAHFELAQEVKNGHLPDSVPGDYAKKYAEHLAEIWSLGKLPLIPQLYTLGCRIEAPSNRTLFGHELLHRFYFQYLGIFSDIKFSVEHLTEMREEEKPVRIAVRWKVSGIHSGAGMFGAPTYLPVYIMGINHVHMSGGKVTDEWMMFDELSIHRQVHLNRMILERKNPESAYNTNY